ncbi:hypothetical protein Acr_27g0000400 [Actinidia rufa]|uniref:Retrotransposon gag domain-containing protein n=1 Tax=Actinidia rufa TaxID=165716 RepID=A0A7J0H5J4_9ERIC|nr:hypothetical protein Acr_27g0000400 [Actinidia rufa]
MNPNNHNNMNNQENVQAGGRTTMDYLCPNTMARESPIHVPVQAYRFKIKPAMLVNLPIVRGVLNENPYTHVELFEEIVSTVRVDVNIRTEWVKLHLFPFSLKERAKEWFNMLRLRSIRTWGRPGESFHKVWERFNECVNAVLHHGFTVSQLVSSFYKGLTSEQRQFVEALSNGRFLSKTPEKAWDYFDELAANNQTWEMAGTTEPTRATGKYVLHNVGDDDVRTQLAKLTRQLKMLTTKKVHEVSTKESHTQTLNDIRSHLSKLTTSMGASQNEKGKFPSQPQPNPQGQHSVGSYNEGHMEHLKEVTTLRSGREVDKTTYPKATNTTGLRTALIPSQSERPSVSVENLKDESVENEQVGGKAHEGVGVRNNGEGKNVDKKSVETPTLAYHPPAPFPQRLQAPKKPNHNAEIYKLFEQVKNNIPLLNAVKQIPAYAKFLKDLCTVKRTLNVKDKTFLMEQIPVILGRPFLATSDAIIQCRNGHVKFSFGNMTCDLKIFDVARQVGDKGSIHEVNYIDTIVQHHIDTELLSDPLLTCLLHSPTRVQKSSTSIPS